MGVDQDGAREQANAVLRGGPLDGARSRFQAGVIAARSGVLEPRNGAAAGTTETATPLPS